MANLFEKAKRNIFDQKKSDDLDFLPKQSDKQLKDMQKEQEEAKNRFDNLANIYQNELEENTGIPHRIKDMIEISPSSHKKYEEIVSKIKSVDVILCIICTAIIFCAYYDNQVISKHYNIIADEFADDSQNLNYRIVIIILDIISVLFICIRYTYDLEIHKLRMGKIADRDTIMSVGWGWYLLIEIIINIMFVPPVYENHFSMAGNIFVRYNYTYRINPQGLFFNNTTDISGSGSSNNSGAQTLQPMIPLDITNLVSEYRTVILTYTISSIMTFFCLVRFYHYVRTIYTFSYWTTPRAKTICKLMNTKTDVNFALKAWLRLNPFISLITGVLIIMAVFGVGVKAFENYNEALVSLISLDDGSTGSNHGKVMRKFSNIYNSYWLILVTMTTIGYGDVYPTTYFGRVLAIVACICGTFILSLLIVFLNTYITFDENEKAIYNQVMDEEVRLKVIRQDAIDIVWKFLKLYYLRRFPSDKAMRLSRIYLYLDLKYTAKKFKIARLNSLKKDVNIEEILQDIKKGLENGIDPIKRELEAYNKDRISNDDSFNNLKASKEICESFFKNSMQMWNLSRVLNKGKCLEGLKNINDVYESQVTILDEIIYYHRFNKDKKDESSLDSISNGEDMRKLDDEEDKKEPDNPYINNSFNNAGKGENKD